MRNIEKLANYVTKNGHESILINTIYGTKNWLICQKVSLNTWSILICDPMEYVTYNLGIITNEQHIRLYVELVRKEIEKRTELSLRAKHRSKEISTLS